MEPKTESVAKHPLLVYIVDDESSMGESMRLITKVNGLEAKVFIHPEWALESLDALYPINISISYDMPVL